MVSCFIAAFSICFIASVELTNVVSRVTLLPSYTADRINPFKLGALLQKNGDHKEYDGYILISPTNVTFAIVITHFVCHLMNSYTD